MTEKLYEYLESLSNKELLVYVKEIHEWDNVGNLPVDSECKNLLSNFENYNLSNLRAEVNYEVNKRFINLISKD